MPLLLWLTIFPRAQLDKFRGNKPCSVSLTKCVTTRRRWNHNFCICFLLINDVKRFVQIPLPQNEKIKCTISNISAFSSVPTLSQLFPSIPSIFKPREKHHFTNVMLLHLVVCQWQHGKHQMHQRVRKKSANLSKNVISDLIREDDFCLSYVR